MTYRFLLFSEEVENFVLEILAPSSATFAELHVLIQDACGYAEDDNHLFLVCDDLWKVREKVYLHDTRNVAMDEDLNLMSDSVLEDFVEGKGQHIAYVFEMQNKKTLLLEMVEELFGETVQSPKVNRRKGVPPVQFEQILEEAVPSPASPQVPHPEEPEDAEVFNDDAYSEDELDMEGFEVNEM